MKSAAIGFKSLACRYFPEVTPKSASARLHAWIKEDVELQNELVLVGFKPYKKILTPKQVELIAAHFGEAE
jgi:hypothetical protein